MWQQIRVDATAQDSDRLEQLLLDHGALSVSLLGCKEPPVFQSTPGAIELWPQLTLLGLFDRSANLAVLLDRLRLEATVKNADSLAVEWLDEQDWESGWMQHFGAMQFGDRLWIVPGWQTPPDPTAINILLDPGLAFGSGSHASTALCLRWLAQQELNHADVIDYGCGSGVLAIAAAMLGAAHVRAVDHEPQALTATVSNRHRNRIDPDRLEVCLADELSSAPADLLLANILAEPLLGLAEKFAAMINSGGMLVLSGILAEQSHALVSAYSQWFIMELPEIEDGWVRLAGRRKPWSTVPLGNRQA